MAHCCSSLYFRYVHPTTGEAIAVSSFQPNTHSNDYTTSGTDVYEFTVSKTTVVWTKTGYKPPGMQSPPITMFSVASEFPDYEIDYVASDSNGANKRYAPASGTITCTASAYRGEGGGGTATVYIFMRSKSPADSITLDKTSLTLTVGEIGTITATASGSVTWSTSDSGIATVSGGVVTAIKAGTAIITATCGIATATCNVDITDGGLDEMTITYNGKTLAKLSQGQTATLACAGKIMETDVVVAAEAVAEVPYVIPAGTYKAGTIQLVELGTQEINYSSNGVNYTDMRMNYFPETTGNQEDPNAVVAAVWILSYNAGNVYEFWPKNDAGEWAGEAYQTITVPERQEVSAAFLDWFTRSFAGIAPETVPEYDGTVTIA